jgi:hypothetical protein
MVPDTGSPLLTSRTVARFAATGVLLLDHRVPDDLNDHVVAEVLGGRPAEGPDARSDPDLRAVLRHMLDLPFIRGALDSLVGPSPTLDHTSVHLKAAHDVAGQPLHADGAVNVRTTAFDVNLMYIPQDVDTSMGGTLVVPGSHLRRTNQADVARYQNLTGQFQVVARAGTVLVMHHALWHCGRPNRSPRPRVMIRMRFSPTVAQVLLWNTTDLDSAEVVSELVNRQPWWEGPSSRIELVRRIFMWRSLIADQNFDIDRTASRCGAIGPMIVISPA